MSKKIKLKFYSTAEELLEKLWGVPIDELKGGEINGYTLENNEEHISTTDDYIDAIKNMGLYGFVAQKKNNPSIIHLWVSDKAKDSEIMHFLGHEIGHTFGRQYKTERLEELKAESFGIVAKTSFKLYKQIKAISRAEMPNNQ